MKCRRIASIADVDNASLYNSARDVVLSDALFTQMRAGYFRYLSRTLSLQQKEVLPVSRPRSAAALLADRTRALDELSAIDKRLKEELDKANQANNDADRMAIVAGLAGMASSIVQGVDADKSGKNSDASATPPKVTTSTSVKRIPGPSGAIIEILRNRIEIEGKVLLNDRKVGITCRRMVT